MAIFPQSNVPCPIDSYVSRPAWYCQARLFGRVHRIDTRPEEPELNQCEPMQKLQLCETE